MYGEKSGGECEEVFQPAHGVLAQHEGELEDEVHEGYEDGQAEDAVGQDGVRQVGYVVAKLGRTLDGFLTCAGYEAVSPVGDDDLWFVAEYRGDVAATCLDGLQDLVAVPFFDYLLVVFEQFQGKPAFAVFFDEFVFGIEVGLYSGEFLFDFVAVLKPVHHPCRTAFGELDDGFKEFV